MENLQNRLFEISVGKILDVGTGRGEFITLLRDHLREYDEIIGIDNSDRSMTYCAEHFNDKKIHFMKMDAEHLTFEDESFDMVCISNSLHHSPNIKTILKEMKRVLKPGGYFLVAEMICDNQTEAQLSHVQLHHWSSKIDTILNIYHALTYTKEQILELMNTLDLNDEEVMEYRYEMENPKDPELFEYFENTINNIALRIKDHEQYETLKQEGNQIMAYIRENGYQTATEVLVIGKK